MAWNRQPQEPSSAPQAAETVAGSGCPDLKRHYRTSVNKKSINMERWESALNDQYAQGYRLAHAFEQDGNTVMVFEHASH